MKRLLAPFLALLAFPVMAFGQTMDTVAAPYDPMLALARAADVAYDAERQPFPYLDPLPRVAQDIAFQIAEEDLGLTGRMPNGGVVWADYGPDRNSVAGRYTWGDEVSLNVRYRDDPEWTSQPWLGVLIHEMIHAQYVWNETRTEIMAYEVEAAMAALGYPGARADLLRSLRLDALLAAWWMAAYEQPDLMSNHPSPFYLPSGDTSRVDAVRHEVLDPVEWRRVEKRMRWWLYSSHLDYSAVIETYVAHVLGTLIPAACSITPVIADASLVGVVAGGMPMTQTVNLPEFRVDDMKAVFNELGYCVVPT